MEQTIYIMKQETNQDITALFMGTKDLRQGLIPQKIPLSPVLIWAFSPTRHLPAMTLIFNNHSTQPEAKTPFGRTQVRKEYERGGYLGKQSYLTFL